MTTLVVAEQQQDQLTAGTLATLTAAHEIGDEVDMLIAGTHCQTLANAASQLTGLRQVLVADQAAYQHQLAENISLLVAELAKGYSHVLAPASTKGKDFMPRVAALLDVAQVSDIIKVVDANTFVRPIYAGNALATVQSADKIKVITVRTTAFNEAADSGGKATIKPLSANHDLAVSLFVEEQQDQSERPELTSSKVVISGGRGLAAEQNFQLVYRIADKLGAAVGASRAAVDAGFVPNDLQVGQTGKVVAPELYIAVGISGAIQHLAGMKDSQVIVAINKDPDAPIFQVADYGLVADLFTALPELAEAL